MEGALECGTRMDSLISNLIRLEGYKATAQDPPTALTVIVVDDEPLMVELLSRTLKDLGHETVATGKDGLQAVEMARKHHPDLIIIDYAMPNMDWHRGGVGDHEGNLRADHHEHRAHR